MNQLLERLKLYEPFFNQYYIDHIVKQYDDMAWICLDNGMLMKVKTLYCLEEEIEKAINHLMVNQYRITSYPNLEDSPYIDQIHYYIEENHQIIGVDLCLLSSGYILNDQTIANDKLRNIGLCYYYGSNQYVQDEYKAFELLDKTSHNHDYKAMCTLGLMYERGFDVQQDLIKAIELYQISADSGYDEAQCNIGYCYGHGIGVEKDLKKAYAYYQEAAKQNNVRALNNLGVMYEYGRGVKQDENKAFDFYQQAAAFDDNTGLFNLARCYEDGIGCDKNIINAIEYFQKSCDIGHILSAFELGRIYHYKYEQYKDFDKAMYYYEIAAKREHGASMTVLAMCYEMRKKI